MTAYRWDLGEGKRTRKTRSGWPACLCVFVCGFVEERASREGDERYTFTLIYIKRSWQDLRKRKAEAYVNEQKIKTTVEGLTRASRLRGGEVATVTTIKRFLNLRRKEEDRKEEKKDEGLESGARLLIESCFFLVSQTRQKSKGGMRFERYRQSVCLLYAYAFFSFLLCTF